MYPVYRFLYLPLKTHTEVMQGQKMFPFFFCNHQVLDLGILLCNKVRLLNVESQLCEE